MEAKHHKQKADATDGWVNGRRNGKYNHPTTRGKRKRKLTLRVLIASPNQCAAFAPSHWFRSHNAFTHTFPAEQIMAVKSFSKDIRKNTSQQGSFFWRWQNKKHAAVREPIPTNSWNFSVVQPAITCAFHTRKQQKNLLTTKNA